MEVLPHHRLDDDFDYWMNADLMDACFDPTLDNAFQKSNSDGYSAPKTEQSVDATSKLEISSPELTEQQSDLQILHIGIWKADRRYKPLRVATGLDTLADANFISANRVSDLGREQNVRRYEGSTFSTACGGQVRPIGRLHLKWHYLMNPSIDYVDEFLVVKTNEVGCVFGIKTIEQRVIFIKGPKFQKTGLKPLDKRKSSMAWHFCSIY
jgi:hypothetical protein